MAVQLPIPPQHDEEEHNAWGPREHRSNQDSASALIEIISLNGCSTNLLSPKANRDCEENSYKDHHEKRICVYSNLKPTGRRL
jgi:hypothetical protein